MPHYPSCMASYGERKLTLQIDIRERGVKAFIGETIFIFVFGVLA